jgi:hypothetical protein
MNSNPSFFKRTLLALLSVLAVVFMASTLISSWQNPQPQTRLDLLQTDLILQSSQLAAGEPLYPIAEILVGTVESDTKPSPRSSPNVTANPVNNSGNSSPTNSANIYAAALSHYQETRQINQTSQERLITALNAESNNQGDRPQDLTNSENDPELNNSRLNNLKKEIAQKQALIRDLDLRIGLLQVATGQVKAATQTWANIPPTNLPEQISQQYGKQNTGQNNQQIGQLIGQQGLNQPDTTGLVAEILGGLWQEPPRVYPRSEKLLKINLDGWYQTQALTRFYQAVQRPDLMPVVTATAQAQAVNATMRLLAVVSVPLVGGLLGALLWLGLLVQWVVRRSASPLTFKLDNQLDESLTAISTSNDTESVTTTNPPKTSATDIVRQQWLVPWDGETVWQVMVLWFTAFVLMSELVLPLGLLILGIRVKQGDNYTVQALFVLIPYLLSVAPMIPLIWASLRQYQPLPEPWLRLYPLRWRWVLWGIGGYVAAVPLVLLVSTLSQTWLNGQGGGNPLLPILVDSRAGLAKFLLWLTLGVAAPFFEEYLFRGFLLPSLVRFMPVWAALGVSGFGFALAHLNIADLLPLTTLGIILGFVYMRSRNLLAPMLMHCLWNSGSFIALIALGGN